MDIFENHLKLLSEELIHYRNLIYMSLLNEKNLAKRNTINIRLQEIDEILKNKYDSMAYNFDEI